MHERGVWHNLLGWNEQIPPFLIAVCLAPTGRNFTILDTTLFLGYNIRVVEFIFAFHLNEIDDAFGFYNEVRFVAASVIISDIKFLRCRTKSVLHISICENPDCNSTFFENYALQASVTLDTELCKNIVADGATAANVGKNRQLTYTILPSTKKDITITADVTDYEMAAIAIDGLQLNMDADIDSVNIDELTEELNKIKDAARELDDGADKLKDGGSELVSGTITLNNGAAELHSGVVSMNNGTYELISGITQLKDGAISLYDGTVEIRYGMAELLDGVISMYDGTVELYDGTVWLKDGTFEFKTETENLDTELKYKMGDAIKDILGGDFEVISFVSEKNKNVESVQFVIQTKAITIPDTP